jgi:hypothetical protein
MRSFDPFAAPGIRAGWMQLVHRSTARSRMRVISRRDNSADVQQTVTLHYDSVEDD